MSSEFMLSQGAGHKLELAIRRNGGTMDDIEWLSTGQNSSAVSLLRTGKAKLIDVSETGSEGVVIPTAPTPTEWTVDGEGNIHFTLTSNGFTRKQWIQCFERRGCEYTYQVLRRTSEAPTNGVTYNIVVRPSNKISKVNRTAKKICVAAKQKGWSKPHWEVACLIRDKFTDEQLEEMGLWSIVTMHEPVSDAEDTPRLLESTREGSGHLLGTICHRPNERLSPLAGFAFVVSQH